MGELGHCLPILPLTAPQAAHSLDEVRGVHSPGMIKNSQHKFSERGEDPSLIQWESQICTEMWIMM